MTLSLSDTEIAWMAGLLEGEGSFGLDSRKKNKYKISTSPPSPYLKISMVDEDVIQKLATLLKKKPFQERRLTRTGKAVFSVSVGDRKTLMYLLPLLYPYFGKRRQAQVKECLDALDAWQIWYSEGGRSEMARQGARALALQNCLLKKENL
jgi:hypothetical protein